MLPVLLLGCDATHSIPLDPEGEDSGAPDVTASVWGTGADGPLDVQGAVDLSAWASGSRQSADVVTATVASIDGATITLAAPPTGFSRDDEVLLIDLHGSDADHAAVGRYAFARLAAVTSTLTLTEPISVEFGDLADQTLIVQRVPQYTDVTVPIDGSLTMRAWDGERGGILAFRATGTLTVEGRITVAALGYEGGWTGGTLDGDGFQGESYAGEGDGGHTSGEGYNGTTGEWAANGGGGGAHITGGGGEHAGGATPAEPWIDGATPAEAGIAYGTADLSTMYFGSGGGGVWNGGGDAGPGGSGGGILFVAARTLDAPGAGAFAATGGTTLAWSQGSYTYGAGGGAGGTLWLTAETMTLGIDALDAGGGDGEWTHDRAGGDGGDGRIRCDCGTINGLDCETEGALTGLATPPLGWIAPLP